MSVRIAGLALKHSMRLAGRDSNALSVGAKIVKTVLSSRTVDSRPAALMRDVSTENFSKTKYRRDLETAIEVAKLHRLCE
jgi:hypothetical protein